MRVRLTRRALEQVDSALVHVATNSPQGADNIRKRLRHVLKLLEIHPLLGPTTDRRGMRRLNLNPYPYFVDYRIFDDEIVVQRFRDAARRP